VENIQSGEDNEKQIVEQTVKEPLDIKKEKLTMKFFYKSNIIIFRKYFISSQMVRSVGYFNF
jgi:hypothetical protein